MSLQDVPTTPGRAYRHGAIVLFVALGTILLALGFEYIGGYVPCPLCLQQRWAYYAAIPATLVGLVLLGAEMPRPAALVLLAIAFAFLANMGLGIYQAGAEWGFWPGPDTCGAVQAIAGKATDLLKTLGSTAVVRCDEAAFRFAGLSFAGWNAVVSFGLFAGALSAAAEAWREGD